MLNVFETKQYVFLVQGKNMGDSRSYLPCNASFYLQTWSAYV